MAIEEVREYIFQFIPSSYEKCPIVMCTMTVMAATVDEANELISRHKWKFFNENLHVTIKFGLVGYREVG